MSADNFKMPIPHSPTKPTKTARVPPAGGSVGFVGYPQQGLFKKSNGAWLDGAGLDIALGFRRASFVGFVGHQSRAFFKNSGSEP
jgi:hypothetical protein